MSAKQLQKLRALREAACGATKLSGEMCGEAVLPNEGDALAKDTERSDVEDETCKRATGFAALVGSDSDSPATEDTTGCSASAEVQPVAKIEGASKSARRRRRKAAAGQTTDHSGGTSAGIATAAAAGDSEEELLEEAAAAAAAQEGVTVAGRPIAGATSFEAGVLAMRHSDFSVENERRRVMGGRGGFGGAGDGAGGPRGRRSAARPRGAAEGRTAHHRRLCLVAPTAEEPWPRPDDGMAMVSCTDSLGATVFDFEETEASARALERLRQCLRAQDLQLLHHFLQQNPFCVDGLLTLAEYYRSQQHAHEQAFQLVRRATYAIECGFNSGFSPFNERGVGPSALRPCVVLRLSDDPAWPGWTWLRALWMHMQGLAGQGMYRTALEGCKLLLAATLPRDPARALFCFDFFCLRSRQYDLIARFAHHLVPQYGLQSSDENEVFHLDLALPNFAYSLALAGFLKSGGPPDASALNEVSIDDVAPPVGSGNREASCTEHATAPEGAVVHARLMRALLLFPLSLRPLLEEAGAKLEGPAPGGSFSRRSWADLLAQPPFSDAADFRHARHSTAHARLCGAYAKRCGSLWRADLVLRWLHSCAARLVGMYESSVFAAELSARRAAWCEATLCLTEALEQDYPDLLPDEGSGEAPKLPSVLEQAAQARLHPPAQQWQEWNEAEGIHNPGGFAGMPPGVAAGHAGPPPPTISLHSPPLLVFFQSLLPWGELDRSGVTVEPLRWSDVARNVVGAAHSVALFALGAFADLARFAASLVRRFALRAGQ